ncbi:MAG: carbohydrate porin [Planctomycetes bacterium]|nr:carbohydrate porin [Planctomycetota bacterium]
MRCRILLSFLVCVSFASAAEAQATGPPRPASNDLPALQKIENGHGEDKKTNGDKNEEATNYSVHGQTTIVSQGNWLFRSPYSGANSFQSRQDLATSATVTLFLAARLWNGGEIVFNPEVAGGNGLSSVFGLGDPTNGEISRVGRLEPTPYIARLFFRQTLGFGGEQEKIEDGPNAIAGYRDVNRLTIAFGKMPPTDSFDTNRYANDPRSKFLNWAAIYNVAWDYPANVRGYDYGISFDYNTKDWAIRYGVFLEPSQANGKDFDPHFARANGHILEFERRHQWAEQPGVWKIASYLNLANMGNYRDALALSPINPDVTLTRQSRIKYGFLFNWQQQLTEDLGVFSRFGWNDGRTETWAYTEADVSGSIGLLLKGKRWNRPSDEVGLFYVISGLSPMHRDYLAAGGLGYELGDGKLSYGVENVLEMYYNCELKKGINATLDYQLVNNPGYNKDRGPVSVLGVRVHFEF